MALYKVTEVIKMEQIVYANNKKEIDEKLKMTVGKCKVIDRKVKKVKENEKIQSSNLC